MKKLICLLLISFSSFANAIPAVMDCEAALGTTLFIYVFEPEEGKAFLSWGHRDFPSYGSLYRNASVIVDPAKDVSHLVFEDGEVIVENGLIRREYLSGRAVAIYESKHREFFSCRRTQ